MSALTQQLEQLKKQQQELEERIKKEEETKKQLENEPSIERLEALVQSPQKNKQLLEEEIYTTIISILKKQERKIEEISSRVNKHFGDFNKRGLIRHYKKIQ